VSKAYLEPEEVQQLEAAAAFMRDKLLIRLLFHLGCRVTEVLGLKVGDIDFKQRLVTIQHLKTWINLTCPACQARLGRIHKYCPVCGLKVEQAVSQAKEQRRFRKLPVDKETLALLKEFLQRSELGTNARDHLVFSLSRHRAWQIVRDLAVKAGLPNLVITESGKQHNVSPHRLRDAFAVHAVKYNDSGDGLRLLQEHLGHHNITTTMKYRKVSGEEQKEWYENLWKGEKENGQVRQS
jgi:integrase/recombinase XerD